MRKLLLWFRGGKAGKMEAAAVKENTDNIPKPGYPNAIYETQPITGIEWVDNDGLLRDEGVLFGIADADYTLKTASIKSSFDKVKSTFIVTKDQLQGLIKSTEQEEDKCLDSISATKKELEGVRLNSVKSTHNLIPGLFQLLVYGAICYFNYYLLLYWLTPVFPGQLFIPIGLYLFGLLSVFMGRALVYNANASISPPEIGPQNKRESWKVMLEELGIPFIVAIFICTLSFRAYPVEWSIAAFALFFFLFSFSGKGLINIIHINYTHIKSQLQHWKRIYSKKKEIKKQVRMLTKMEKEKEKYVAELKIPLTKISELDAIFSYKIKVFESEYNLARESRSELSDKQRTSF